MVWPSRRVLLARRICRVLGFVNETDSLGERGTVWWGKILRESGM